MTVAEEETKTEGPSRGDIHGLRRDYDDAVDCLAKCDGIIQELMGQIKSKDDRIAGLEDKVAEMEEKIIQMSLELASSKAFEDEHRSTRRVSAAAVDFEDGGDKDEGRGQSGSRADKTGRRPPPRRAMSMDVKSIHGTKHSSPRSSFDVRPGEAAAAPRKSSWWAGSVSTASTAASTARDLYEDFDASSSSLRRSTDARSADALDESCSSGLSMDIGRFLFRKGRGVDGRPRQTQREDKNKEAGDGGGAANADGREEARRRPATRRRPSRRNTEPPLKSSLNSLGSLKGVVFPSSFESVVVRGCLELGSSFKDSLRDSLRDSLKGAASADLRREILGGEDRSRGAPRAA